MEGEERGGRTFANLHRVLQFVFFLDPLGTLGHEVHEPEHDHPDKHRGQVVKVSSDMHNRNNNTAKPLIKEVGIDLDGHLHDVVVEFADYDHYGDESDAQVGQAHIDRLLSVHEGSELAAGYHEMTSHDEFQEE